MTKLHLALGALSQLVTLLLSLDLVFEASFTEYVATGEPFGVLGKYISADGALKFFVHLLILVGSQSYCDRGTGSVLTLRSAHYDDLACLLVARVFKV